MITPQWQEQHPGWTALLFGFYTRLAAFIMSGEMAVPYFMVQLPRGIIPYNNGGSLAVLYCFVFLYLALVGGGEWSVDTKLAKAQRQNASAPAQNGISTLHRGNATTFRKTTDRAELAC